MSQLPLAEVIAIVESEGVRLHAEFYLPRGPRGERGSAPIDREIELRLRAKLQALVPCTFCGEECETVPGAQQGWTWLVDPHDGTFEFTQGRRGSSISVALLRGNVPVLGVVHSPDSPDRGLDRKSTRLNSSHMSISYAVFCLKKKKITKLQHIINKKKKKKKNKKTQ